MTTQANRTHHILPFVPAKDFEQATAFYAALGFEVDFTKDDDSIRFCHHGDCGFLLQNFYVKEWADNCMMAMHVDNAQAWLDQANQLVKDYAGVRTSPLQLQKSRGVLLGHIWDPSGVLWHISQDPIAEQMT